jgi:ankyrin repeat protein
MAGDGEIHKPATMPTETTRSRESQILHSFCTLFDSDEEDEDDGIDSQHTVVEDVNLDALKNIPLTVLSYCDKFQYGQVNPFVKTCSFATDPYLTGSDTTISPEYLFGCSSYNYDTPMEQDSQYILESGQAQCIEPHEIHRLESSDSIDQACLLFAQDYDSSADEQSSSDDAIDILSKSHQSCDSDSSDSTDEEELPLIKVFSHQKNATQVTNKMFVCACENGNLRLVSDILEENCVDPSWNDNIAIVNACRNGHSEIVELLLGHPKVDPTSRGHFGFLEACRLGHIDVVKILLLDPRIDPTVKCNKALELCCSNGHVEIMFLLQADMRVDLAARDNIAFCAAVENGFLEIVSALLEDYRVDPSCRDHFAIRYACKSGNLELFNILMNSGKIDIKSIESDLVALAKQNKHGAILQKLDSGWTFGDVIKHIRDSKLRDSKRFEIVAEEKLRKRKVGVT